MSTNKHVSYRIRNKLLNFFIKSHYLLFLHKFLNLF